ncbi:MAG: 4-hydroxy-tetrahydrodipicolinate synthase, partial [Candidatus Omnitrophica bacterium]|nr:4-hydroxy-tetrahydrodipicolinate synthase [Candidatus Omnitrophota bacterium]
VTPFENGKIDEESYSKLIEFQIENGTDGILPCGTTGESATLTMDEQKKLISMSVEMADKRIKVLAGAGSNNTVEALDLASYAKTAGADAALVITPYYNKPTPEGQYRHFKKIATEVDIPIMLYNVPSRTGISILPSTVARLAEIDNIIAIKEAAGSVEQVQNILSLCDITVMSGDDGLTLPFMAVGAKGVVSVAANVIPGKVHEMTQSYLDGDHDNSRKVHYEILEFCGAMFIETNPLPVKTTLNLMGMVNKEWRLPLCEMEAANEEKLKKVLKKYKLI